MKVVFKSYSNGFTIEDKSNILLDASYQDVDLTVLSTIYRSTEITINPAPQVTIIKNDVPRGKVVFAPNDTGTLTLDEIISNNKDLSFCLRETWYGRRYELRDSEKNMIIDLKITGNLLQKSYEFQVSIYDYAVPEVNLVELVFYSCYIANKFLLDQRKKHG